ncbi:Fibroblast growth factor 4B [Triplophysa tibetana]|uniref:Fibroblast growth factor n=1 Tax=Triplophysa tibetana TaxID=1572043 RepID=A0A5A9PTS9_9TELE|nr:Fibroblast growth factor 4B [Triplophysa tibetana]
MVIIITAATSSSSAALLFSSTEGLIALHARSPDLPSKNKPLPPCRKKKNKSGIFRVINFDHVPRGTNATQLEKSWETLFSRSVLGISMDKSDMNWENDYLMGIKRVRRLYCNVGIGFHLQVLQDGRINGVHNENQYSVIEISSVERGVVSLYGVKSKHFVAMSSRGRLYGTRVFRDECKFKEMLLPNNYNTYESSIYKGFYIALSKHGRLKRGYKASPVMTVTHFLPRLLAKPAKTQ